MGVSEHKNRQSLEIARFRILDMSVPHHLWGHAILSVALSVLLVGVLDFKTPHDVFGDHVSSVSESPSWLLKFLGVLPMFMSTLINGVNLILVLCDVFLCGYSFTQKGYKCYHPPTQNVHRGSELESLGLANDVFEDAAIGKETTCRTKVSNRSPISEDETCGPCEKTTDRPLELDQSPISGDEVGALGVATTWSH
ncbi:unnamed protein product [Prunus armeniaca]